MGKITVKHYLEKRVNPLDWSDIDNKLQDKLLYPVYVQIVNKRKTIQIRSFSEVLMTEKGFKVFIETGKTLSNETCTVFSYKDNSIELNKEIDLIQKVVKYNNDVIKSERPIREIITKLIISFNTIAIKGAWLTYQSNFANPIYDKYWNFVNSFNKDKSLFDSIELIKEYTQIDLKSKLLNEFNITWDCLTILTSLFKEFRFIDVVVNDYKSIIKKYIKNSTKAYIDRILTETDIIIELYVDDCKF